MGRGYTKFWGWVLAIVAGIWIISPPPWKADAIHYVIVTATLCLGIRWIWKGDD